MFRMLMLLAGAGTLVARYLTGSEGERRRQVLRQRLAGGGQRLGAFAANPPAGPVANFFAQVGIAAIVARAGRRGGVQGAATALLAETLLRRLKPSRSLPRSRDRVRAR